MQLAGSSMQVATLVWPGAGWAREALSTSAVEPQLKSGTQPMPRPSTLTCSSEAVFGVCVEPSPSRDKT